MVENLFSVVFVFDFFFNIKSLVTAIIQVLLEFGPWCSAASVLGERMAARVHSTLKNISARTASLLKLYVVMATQHSAIATERGDSGSCDQ